MTSFPSLVQNSSGVNPIIDELDAMSPHAKGALAMAHTAMLAQAQQPQEQLGATGGHVPDPAPMTQKPPVPSLGAPMQGAAAQAPASGSEPMTQPNMAPPLSPHQAELGRLQSSGSGISQIHNPWLRGLAQVGDAIGGGLFPGIEQRLPGTQGHHDVLVHQAQGAVANDENEARNAAELASTQANTAHQAAETAKLQNPVPADQEDPAAAKTITTEDGIQQWDPKTQRYDIPAGKTPGKPDKYTFQQTDHGLMRIDSATGEAQPVTLNGEPLKGKDPIEKAPSHDDKYISIMAKPPAQRTSEENAFTRSYEHWTNVSKTQPGIARMEVLMNGRPVTAVDPNNPDSLIYERAGDAMRSGAQAPGSIAQSVRKGVENDFTHGKDATVLTNINTAHEHTAQLLRVAEALKNGDSKLVNQLSNAWADQTGQPAPASFQLVKTALAGEIAKTFTGGVATVDEGKEITKAINAANSPAAFAGVAANAQRLMESKRRQLKDQYEAGLKGQGNFGAGKGQQSQPSSDMVTVQIPGTQPGQIHRSQFEAFKKRFPNATEVK